MTEEVEEGRVRMGEDREVTKRNRKLVKYGDRDQKSGGGMKRYAEGCVNRK